MKLLIVYQFYLDYFLPRNDEWEDKQFGFELDDGTIFVRPKNIAEDLFPGEIDRTLSTMIFSLTKLSIATSTLSKTVKDVVVDRIEVRLKMTLEKVETLKDKKFQEDRLDKAIKGCNIFLNHCRALSMNPFVKPLPREYSLEHRRYCNMFPRSMTYLNEDNLSERPNVFNGVNGAAASGEIRSPERGIVDIHRLIRAITTAEPDFYNSLVVDSLEAISTGRLKEAVVFLAICCETKIKKALSDKEISESQLQKHRKRNESFASNYFDIIPKTFTGRSLRSEDNDTFKSIEELYRVRNNIAHEGKCVLDLENGSERKVDETGCEDFVNATQKVLTWINSAFK